MSPQARGPRAGRTAKPALPKAITDRTDRLVEISDHCAAARRIAEEQGEDFLAYLLSMVTHETASAMRRAAAGAPSPAKARRPMKLSSR